MDENNFVFYAWPSIDQLYPETLSMGEVDETNFDDKSKSSGSVWPVAHDNIFGSYPWPMVLVEDENEPSTSKQQLEFVVGNGNGNGNGDEEDINDGSNSNSPFPFQSLPFIEYQDDDEEVGVEVEDRLPIPQCFGVADGISSGEYLWMLEMLVLPHPSLPDDDNDDEELSQSFGDDSDGEWNLDMLPFPFLSSVESSSTSSVQGDSEGDDLYMLTSRESANREIVNIEGGVWGEEYNWIWEFTPNIGGSGLHEEEEELVSNKEVHGTSNDSSESGVYLFSLLPIELVRLIFEKMVEDDPWPTHLLLISKQINSWLEPFLYKHICITTLRTWKRFYRTFRSRQEFKSSDISPFENNIRSLFVSTGVYRSNQIIDVIKVVKHLQCLSIWDDNYGSSVLEVIFSSYEKQKLDFEIKTLNQGLDWDHSEIYKNNPYKDIRRLSFSASFLLLGHRSFVHPAFHSITHLDVYFDENVPWKTLTSLKQLTHISFDLATFNNLTIDVMTRWMMTISSYCSSNVKVIIFGCVTTFEADFDIMDSDGEYLPQFTQIEGLNNFDSLDTTSSSDVDVNDLHPFTQLCLGLLDPRAVAGCVSHGLPETHMFRDVMVFFLYPDNVKDWDGRLAGHKECWTVAEEIIEKRKGLTYADFVDRVAKFI